MAGRLTPKQFAARIGKSLNFVMKLINHGELIVEDVRAPGASLPRYQIDQQQVYSWRASRRKRIAPPGKVKRPSRLKPAPEVIH